MVPSQSIRILIQHTHNLILCVSFKTALYVKDCVFILIRTTYTNDKDLYITTEVSVAVRSNFLLVLAYSDDNTEQMGLLSLIAQYPHFRFHDVLVKQHFEFKNLFITVQNKIKNTIEKYIGIFNVLVIANKFQLYWCGSGSYIVVSATNIHFSSNSYYFPWHRKLSW